MPNLSQNFSPSAPKIINAQGGSQSALGLRLDLLPPQAILDIAATLYLGAVKYGENNWHKIPLPDHLNHALAHLFAYLSGDTQDAHLNHATCRLLFALEHQLNPTLNETKPASL